MANLTHYVDLRCRPNPEIRSHEILSDAMTRLHMALVTQPELQVAVCFPQRRRHEWTLGDVMRLHGSAEDVEVLMAILMPGEGGLQDYVQASGVRPVPPNTTQHWRVVRRQFKTNVDRERRRYCRRFRVSWEEACRKLPVEMEDRPNLPYLWMRSHSSRQQFTLHIDHHRVSTPSVQGGFNRYGLSIGGTVPAFD